MAVAINGVQKIEIGAAGANGAMGATLAVLNDIKVGSVQLDIPEVKSKSIEVEDKDGVRWTLKTSRDVDTLKLGTHDMSNATMIRIFGGTETSGVYTPPTIEPENVVSIKLTTKTLEGKKTIWSFPQCNLIGSATIDFTKEDVSSVTLTARIQIPIDGAGAALPRFKKEDVSV